MALSDTWIVCGTTHDDAEVEARIVALRRVEGHQAEAGCGKNIRADFAYRCVECGRWFHRECILAHFASHGDHYADTIATLTRERDEAREHRRILREWIDKDKTGLYAALTKVIKAIEARGWITEGRGPYEWDDERYQQETAWAFDEVRKIVVEAQKESDERMKKALAATEVQADG